MLHREVRELSAMGRGHRVSEDQDGLGAFGEHRLVRLVEFVGTPHRQELQLDP